MQNFNVGDMTVNIGDVKFWDNPYHYQLTLNTIKPKPVTGASEEWFTVKPEINVDKFRRGLDDYYIKAHVRHQKNGMPWDGASDQVVNLTNNKPRLMAYLNQQFDVAFQKCDEEDAAEIKKLESEIEFLKKKIEAVKAGKRPVSYNTAIIQRDFLNDRKAALLEILK